MIPHVLDHNPSRRQRLKASLVLLAVAALIGLAVIAMVGDAMVLALATST
ncbi:MAG TPA: hypothetical protein VFK69_13000 [Candidatus Eisenbacteria bacterium]|nr:hypothetical protein [Candidatus Eisenbacteria bacterium]